MPPKIRISAAEYATLDAALQAFYVSDGEDYRVISDDRDIGALKRAKDRETQRATELAERVRELEQKLASVSDVDARKRGDIETLEKSWNKKMDTLTKEKDEVILRLTNWLQKGTADAIAETIATRISTAPRLLVPLLKSRLTVDTSGEEPVTRVLDAAGKISAMSIADLEKEFVDNSEYKPIIIANKASGSGDARNKGQGGSGSTGASGGGGSSLSDLTKLTPEELAAHIKAMKEGA